MRSDYLLKKRFLHRNDWTRIIKRDYSLEQINHKDFNGFIALIKMNEVKEPLITEYLIKKLCIVDNNYLWLQQLPLNENFAITSMFNENGEIIQWYIDITYENGVENGEPYMLDLFLDIVVLRTGEIIEKDKDELEEALHNNWITKSQYDFAYRVFYQMLKQIHEGTFKYFDLSLKHRDYLLGKIRE